MSSVPYEFEAGHGRLDRIGEPIDSTFARFQRGGREQQHVSGFGFRDDYWCQTTGCSPHCFGLIIAVIRIERNRKSSATCFPLWALSNRAMRDFAQRTVSTAEACADPIRQLAAQRAVGVVHADEPDDSRRRHVSARYTAGRECCPYETLAA